ncbi:uncharacterized protein LOC131431540 [Malaya genurostris]|uniref:uncharacterized protein LOC131431540 n=1 Tax=Malaya genurostris TaxID=325434 RepID=UPI0026F3E6E1|nr:uncharacterized protein LOC131431540 [Malaya genurostris]
MSENNMNRAREQSERLPFRNQSQNRHEVSEPDGDIEDIIKKIDVHSFTGLMTILAVNLQQLYWLINVGPDLGAMFYFMITLTSISAILVITLLPVRTILEGSSKFKVRKTKKWRILYYTSLVLNVMIFVVNLALQIFDQTMEKCQVLLNQPLPISDKTTK